MTRFRVRIPTTDPEELFAMPRRFVLGRPSYLCVFSDEGTFCMVAAGEIAETQIHDFIDVVAKAPNRKRRQYIDLRRVLRYSDRAMDALIRFYGGQSKDQTSRFVGEVEREAVVRPDGALGAFAEGFYRTNPMPFPTQVFQEPSEAFGWLGDERGLSGFPLDEWLGRNSERSALETLLRREGAAATLGSCAQALGVSARTLQRRLQEQSTDFRGVRQAVLMELAKRRLVETDTPIKAIAAELQFTSATRFSEAFHRAFLISPREYRRRARAERSEEP